MDSTKTWFSSNSASPLIGERARAPAMNQEPLFFRRVSTPLPGQPNGKDIGFRCFTDDGGLYYCKDDKDNRSIRATEWICTHLARHLGISVAECNIIEDDLGKTYFGSRSPASLADDVEMSRHIGTPATGEFGQPVLWLGQYLAGLFAYDMFIDNVDRCPRNFVLDHDGRPSRLCAIDFASARLMDFSIDRFPVESDSTVWVRRSLRRMHGGHLDSAYEMLDRIAAVPEQILAGIVMQMPEDWLTKGQREGLWEFWSDGRRHDRITRLRVVIAHESQI